MRKTVLILGLILLPVFVFSFSEEVEVYAYLYRNSSNNLSRLTILQNMEQQRLTGAGEFYATALRDLVEGYTNIRSSTEKDAAADMAIILSKMLGIEKYSQSAENLWRVVDAFPEPLVKSEALIALGRIRSATYLPHTIRLLNNYNERATTDRLSGERIAFGAIIALEKYQDPSGYLPVFIASTAWYSDRIRGQARKSMPLISKDPTEYMLQVVNGQRYSPSVKLIALQNIESIDVSAQDKSKVAVAALAEGWRLTPPSANIVMRKLAIDMINKYKTDDTSVYPLLDRSLTQDSDIDERLKAIASLASQQTEESVEILSKHLLRLVPRVEGSVGSIQVRDDDRRLLQAIIPALGHTKKASARRALNTVVSSKLTNAIKNSADDALKNIPY